MEHFSASPTTPLHHAASSHSLASQPLRHRPTMPIKASEEPPLQTSHRTETPAPPPQPTKPLAVSEAMRRIQDLLHANKFSTSDEILFKYQTRPFTAQILQDGSLKAELPSPSSAASGDASSSHRLKLFSSPSEFASEAAASAISTDENTVRPRGKVSINGWSECTVNGRTLATIRSEMLRERKSEQLDVSEHEKSEHLQGENEADKRKSEDASTRSGKEPLKSGDPSDSSIVYEKAPNETPLPDATERHDEALQDPDATTTKSTDPDASKDRDNKPTDGKPLASDTRVEEDADGSGRSDEETLERKEEVPFHRKDSKSPEKSIVRPSTPNPKQTPGLEPSNPTSQDAHVAEDVTSLPDVPSGAKAGDPERNIDSSTSAKPPAENGDGDASAREEGVELDRSNQKQLTSESGDEMIDDVSAKKEQGQETSSVYEKPATVSGHEPMKHEASPREVGEKDGTVHEKQSLAKSPETMAQMKNRSDAKSNLHSSDGSTGSDHKRSSDVVDAVTGDKKDSDKMEIEGEQDPSTKDVPDLQQEILGASDSEEEIDSLEEQGASRATKKRPRSPQDSDRKRKRTRGSDSSRSEEGALSHELLESVGTSSGEGNGFAPQKTESEPQRSLDAANMDPDTMEAAAVAAQIEKEEANRRARRTTRLAAGKIKQVDYKASAGAQPPRNESPGQMSEENDGISVENDSQTEAGRGARRRASQALPSSQQRNSRRISRSRGSQDKEQLSTDELETSGSRSTGNSNEKAGRTQAEGQTADENMEVDSGPGSRHNNARTDATERRRGRTENGQKRSRQANLDTADIDTTTKTYSTRASVRENSVADGTEAVMRGDLDDMFSESEDEDGEPHQARRGDSHHARRSEGRPFTTNDIEDIADCLRSTTSTSTSVIFEMLQDRMKWRSEDIRSRKLSAFMKKMHDSIRALSQSVGLTEEEIDAEDDVEQRLAYLACEEWRMKSGGLFNGCGSKPKSVMRKAAKEDQLRASLERSRRKEHRDVEEMRGTLEKEMESRRRAELDTAFVEIQVFETARALTREKACCMRYREETEKYKDMEADVRGRLEKAKNLVAHLLGERDNMHEMSNKARKRFRQADTRRSVSRANGSFPGNKVGSRDESGTSDDDVEMTDKNITTTSQRLLEMDRLRALIAAREAEAEHYRRICERERMRFATAMEHKNRLETEIYLQKSHTVASQSIAGSSTLPTGNKSTKESGKKGDARGLSAMSGRATNASRPKSNPSKNMNSGAGSNSKGNLASKSKTSSGRASEALKSAKRKAAARAGANNSNKPT